MKLFCVEMYAGNSHEEADPATGKPVTRHKGDMFYSMSDLAALHPEKFRLVQEPPPHLAVMMFKDPEFGDSDGGKDDLTQTTNPFPGPAE